MNIKLIFSTLVIACAPCVYSSESAAWPIVYEGKTHPLDAGSVKFFGQEAKEFSAPAKGNYLVEVQADGLKFEFPAAGTFGLELADQTYNFNEGTTVECRLRLEETVNQIDPPTKNSSAVMIQFSEPAGNDPGLWSLGFYTDSEDGKNYAVLEGANSTVPYEIGKEFRTYRVVTKDNLATLIVDGVVVGEVKPRKGLQAVGLRFGNLRGKDHSGSAVLESIRIDPTQALMP